LSNQDATATTLEKPQESPTILLIAHKKNQFSSAATFLIRRGVPCTIKGNIKEAIAHIQKEKPTFVFLSWNLPHANIPKTYQLFTKTFKVNCVVFAEKSDGKTAAQLTNSHIPQTMQAPVSGPGLYMRIQKLIKEKEENQNSESHAPKYHESRTNEKGDKIVLKSSHKEDKKDSYITLSSHKDESNKPGMINFQKPQYREEDIEDQSLDTGDENDISAYLNDIPEDDALFTSQDQDYGSVTNLAKDFSNDAPLPQYEVTRPKEDLLVSVEKKETSHLDANLDSTKSADVRFLSNFQPQAKTKIAKTLLFEKTLQAIHDSLRPIQSEYGKVQVVAKARIMNIHSSRFHGYLIWAVPMFHELDRNLFSQIKEKLQTLLQQSGEELKSFHDFNVDLEQVNFLDWCNEYAEFHIESADKSTEIICAYFPTEPSLPKTEDTNVKMAAIEPKDLKAQTKLNFSLFIHLPKNNKFLKYLKSGDILTESHNQKFEKYKVKKLHITKDDQEHFNEYFASNRINETIRKKKAS